MKEWNKTIEENEAEVFSCIYRDRILTVIHDMEGYSCYMRDDHSHYQCGKAKSLEEAKKRLEDLADKMALNFAGKWHKYPEEKPKEGGEYLITVEGENVITTADEWIEEEGCWSEEKTWSVYDCMPYAHITAWAEMPRPYGEGEE